MNDEGFQRGLASVLKSVDMDPPPGVEGRSGLIVDRRHGRPRAAAVAAAVIAVATAVTVAAQLGAGQSGDTLRVSDPTATQPPPGEQAEPPTAAEDRCGVGRSLDEKQSRLGGPAVDIESYIGMPAAQAEARARAAGLTWRVVGIDGSCFDREEDYNTGRINVYIADGIVVRASQG